MRHRYGLWVLALVTSLLAPPSVGATEPVYSVGVVPQFDSRRIHNNWAPLLKEVSQRAGVRLRLVGSPSIPAFEAGFNAGEFDFAYMNPYHSVKAHEVQGYQPLVRDVAKSLYGIIVVRKDSGIHTLEDLRGQVVAFPAPNALGAALIPRAELADKFRIPFTPRYVKSHSSVYLNVVLGQAAAGGGVQKTLAQQPAEIRNQLRVIYETSRVAPHPVVVHPRVPAQVAQRVREAFQSLSTSPVGRELLAAVPITEIGPATLADYEALREMGLEKHYVVQ